MFRNHETDNVGSERITGFEGSFPVCVVVMEWDLVVWRSAVVALKLIGDSL